MFKKIYNLHIDITEAPPYESFEKYGGNINIDKYRNNLPLQKNE